MVSIFVESGSTKSDWVLLENGKKTYLQTMGFNPYFHDEDFIANKINDKAELSKKRKEVAEIFFYGAGCSTEALNTVVERALNKQFPNAEIHVGHDLAACAYACYGGEPIIACIMGTGSNSCFFDGKEIYEEVPALAYVLGDEGSGSYYGKQLLSKYLYKELPQDIYEDFKNIYQLDKDEIISNVYFKPHANVYIASFGKFLSRHPEHPFVVEMIEEGCRRFLKTHVLCYDQAKEVKVHFVGSIAHHFEDILRKEANKLGIKMGKVCRRPLDGLVHYHQTYAQNRSKIKFNGKISM